MAADTDRCAPAHDAHDSESPAPANIAHADGSALACVTHVSAALTATSAADTDCCALAHDARDSESPAPANIAHADGRALACDTHVSAALTAASAAGTASSALAHDAHDSKVPSPARDAHADSGALALGAHDHDGLTAALLPDKKHLVLFAVAYLESGDRVLLDWAHDQFLLPDLGDVEDATRMREHLILELRADPFLDDDVLAVLKVRVSIMSIRKLYGEGLRHPIPTAASRTRVSQSPSAFDVSGSRLA